MIFKIAGFFAFLFRSIPLGSYRLRYIVRRFLRRFGEMLVGHLQIVLRCHARAIAEPGTDNMRRKGLFQLRLPRAAKVLK